MPNPFDQLVPRLQDLIQRLPPPTSRNLWLLTAALVACHNLWVIHTTQDVPRILVVSLLCWWGALTCMEDRIDTLQPRPSRPGMVLGLVLLSLCLAASAQVVGRHGVIYVLGPLEVVALALLCVPMRRLGQFWQQILVLCLAPMAILLEKLLPYGPISVLTARLASMVVGILGYPSEVNGNVILIGPARVQVIGLCSGLDQIAMLIIVTIIFLLAFPLRRPAHRLTVLLLAPVIAVIGNTLRISLLVTIVYLERNAGVTTSGWWFNFFHDAEGSLLFAMASVSVLGYLYLKIIDRELGPA
ncbi:MAG: archaeosortase/exosortase family protein [Cyanobacteriota bacterium]|nr:archaeosortase/exosortase family protein [Cyanobacteriota bacterium]